jgi:hypothetical protein
MSRRWRWEMAGESGGERAAVQMLCDIRGRPAVATASGLRVALVPLSDRTKTATQRRKDAKAQEKQESSLRLRAASSHGIKVRMVETLALSPGERENRSPVFGDFVRWNWQEGYRAISGRTTAAPSPWGRSEGGRETFFNAKAQRRLENRKSFASPRLCDFALRSAHQVCLVLRHWLP